MPKLRRGIAVAAVLGQRTDGVCRGIFLTDHTVSRVQSEACGDSRKNCLVLPRWEGIVRE